MIWKTTINKITGLTFAKSITLAFLAIFLFSANNAQAQVFTPDGNYSASEYAGAVVKDIDLGATGTCQIKQVYSIVKSDSEGPYLLLGFYNGNPGQATFRYYLDTDPNLDLVSETFQGTSYNFPGADVVLQTNASGDGTRIFKYDGSNLVETTDSGIIAAVGDYNLNDGKFIEVKVPLSGDGSIVDICDLAEDFTINLGSYLSFAGKSTTAKVCDFEDISLLIDANGAINGGTAYCSTTNSTILTLSGNYGEVIRWQENDGSGWVNISNTSNTYTANNVAVTTNYRAVIVNNTCPGNEVETGIATITINETPTAEAGNTAELTCSVQTLQLNGSGTGQGNLSYAWTASNGGVIDSGANTATPTVSATGTYTLTVTDDDNGCSATDTVIITQDNTAPTAEAGETMELTCSVQTLQLNGSGTGQGNLSYAWIASNGGVIDSGANTATPTVSATGTYTLTVTDDDNGCSATDTVIITQDNTAPTAEAGETMELTCSVQTLQLNGSGTGQGNLSYTWTTSNGGVIDSGANTATPTVSATGTYTLTVTDDDNGCSATDTVIITQDNTAPTAEAGETMELTCSVQTLQLNGSGTGQGNLSYTWTASNGGVIDSGANTATPTVSATGTYTLTVTDDDNGCSATDTVIITQDNTAPTAEAGNTAELTCSVQTLQLNGSGTGQGNLSYAWIASNGGVIDSGANTATPTVSATGTYTLTVTDDDNGCSATDTVIITQDNTAPTAEAGNTAELTCSIQTLQLNGSGTGQGNLSYAWTASNGGVIDSGANTATPTVSATGTYTLTVTDDDNGCSATDTVIITQDNTAPTAEAGNTAELTCSVQTLQLNGSGTGQGNLSYAWTASNGGVIDSGANTATPTVSATGTYTLTVTDDDNGCSATDTVIITQDNTAPTAEAGNTAELTCSVQTLQLNGSGTGQGNLSYAWTTSNGGVIDSGANTATPTVSATGTYTLTVTDDDNGCSATDTVIITQDNTAPTAEAGETMELTCTTTSVTLNGSGDSTNEDANLSYAWTGPGEFTSDEAMPSVSVVGTYTLTVTDNDNGCFVTDSVEVTQDITTPTAEAGETMELTCTTTSVTLNGSGDSTNDDANLSYAWTGPGEFTSDVAMPSVTVEGTYTLTVTDLDNGCFATDTVEVTKDANVPTAAIKGNDELTCTTTEITLDASTSIVQGTASYSWTLNTADGTQLGTSATLDVDTPGTYFVTVTDSDNGCSGSTSVSVAQDITPVVADITGNQELTCTTTEITLDASTSTVQGTASYSWTMNSADGTQVGTGATLNVDAPGTYFVTVTDSDNGCSASTSVTVAQDITPVVADITGNQELTCTTTEITLDASASTVQGTASYSWTLNAADGTQVGTGATLNVDAPGTYFVTVTDSDNGCSGSTSVSVAQDITPVVADITGNQELTCNTTEITLDASPSSVQGTASYSWTMNTADGTQVGTGATLNVDAPGTYYVTVTDSDNGCSASTSVTVAQDVLSVEAIITGNEDLDCNNTSVILDAGSSIVQSTATYLWSTGEISESIEVTEAGEYTVTVTDSDNGCSDEISVILNFIEDTEPPVITDCAVEVNVSADAGICEASEVDLGMPIATDNCPAELTIENDAPEVFPLGQTIVTWTITDASNNSTQCEQIVNVRDDQAPVITECAAPLTVPADMGICSASQVELGMPVATDNCNADLTITNDAPEVFELGDTTVSWTVTDNAGNTATCTQIVTVVDDQAPVVETMTNIEVNSDAGVCGAVVNFEMIGATDNCEIASVEVTEGLVSGSEFPIGTTSVTWTVTDGSGNSITSTFTVTVEDNEAPEISCPGNMTVSTETGVSYATVDFDNATATDNCEVSVEQTGGPVSGSQFEIGTTTVTFTATDAAGNTSECSFTVTVEDNEDPSIICPSNIEQSNDEGICGATIEFAEPDFADNSGEVTIEQTAGPASGEIFPVGTTTVTYLVTDAAGNTAECSFTVTITDDEGPSIEQKDNITVGNDQGSCGAVVNFATPEATDNCGIESVTLTEGLDSGSEFPNGTTSVVFTATDTQGNTATSTFTVTVNDTEAPSIECPENISVTVENGTESVVVEYTSVFTIDNCEGTTVELTEGLASGEAFLVGETTITYTVTEAAGNSTSCSFTVTVDEEELPTAPAAPSATLTQATCAEPTGTITVETVEGLTYSIDGENYQTEGVFADLAPGIYDVVAQDEFGQLSELTTVVIEDPVAQEIETVSIDPICDDQGDFDLFDLLTGDYDETGNWIDTNNSGALNGNILDPSVPAPGSYTFEYLIEGNCPSITTVSLTIDDCVVLDCSIEDIKDGISKAVTPNGDNKNDVFKVDLDLACGFTYNVKIFNRWGAKVFDAPNYQNNWDGYSDSSFTSSNQLPSGTYFYILEIREGNFEPIQGYIYLGTK